MSGPSRRAAVATWSVLLATPVLFGFVTAVAAPPQGTRSPEMGALLVWMSSAVVGLGIALARLLPARIHARHQGSGPAVAFVRMAAGWGILEGAAMFPLVAAIVTGNAMLYVVSAVAVAALAASFPSEERWSGHAVQATAGARAARGGGA